MDKKQAMKFIVDNYTAMSHLDKLNLVYNLNKDHVKIYESGDGCRIWLNRLPLSKLIKICAYIQGVMDRDAK